MITNKAGRDTHRVILVALLMAAGSAAVGADAAALRPRTVLFVLIPLGLIYVVRRQWGSVAVAGVPFLLPDLPSRFGVPGSIQLALLTTIMAIIYWDTIGRPRVSSWALRGAVVFAVTTIILALAHGKAMPTAEWVSLAAFAGLIFGTSLAASQTARVALGFGCVPLALLSIAEVAGFNNPWPSLVHATNFVGLDVIEFARRAQSTFGHPLIAGGCLAATAMLMAQSRTRYCTPVAAVLALGAIATVSRSSILGLGVALACSILVTRRPGRHLLQVIVIVIAAYAIAIQIPALKASITNRLEGGQQVSFSFSDQPVRAFAFATVTHDLTAHTFSLFLGDGTGATAKMLTDLGGIDGFDIFDNQYATSIFDLGLLPMFVVGFLVLRAIASANPEARRLGLPALSVVAVVMFFVDGGYWLSLGWLAWVTVGVASASLIDVPAPGELAAWSWPALLSSRTAGTGGSGGARARTRAEHLEGAHSRLRAGRG